MKIRLVVHLDVADEQPMWWAESPDVPGFTATDRHLRGLRRRAARALRAIAIDRGWEGPLDVRPELAPFEAETDNPPAVAGATPESLGAPRAHMGQIGPIIYPVPARPDFVHG